MNISRFTKVAVVAVCLACIAPVASASAYSVWKEAKYNPCTHVLKVEAGLYPTPSTAERWYIGVTAYDSAYSPLTRFLGWNEMKNYWVNLPSSLAPPYGFTGYSRAFGYELIPNNPAGFNPSHVYVWISDPGSIHTWQGYVPITTVQCISNPMDALAKGAQNGSDLLYAISLGYGSIN
jgi:hypothetical protein